MQIKWCITKNNLYKQNHVDSRNKQCGGGG